MTSGVHRERMGVHLLSAGVLVALLVVLGGLLGPSGAAPSATPVDGPTALEAAAPRCVDEPAVAPQQRPRADPAAGRPEWIRIPRLGVAVPVVGISLQGGALVPPPDPWQLGWWNGGAVPGARRGTAVITGHTVSNGDGALDDLHLLRAGDRFYVRTVHGRIPYTVSAVTHYSRAQLARVSGTVFSQRVRGQLVLTTCTDFDGHEYHGNTLVFARPER